MVIRKVFALFFFVLLLIGTTAKGAGYFKTNDFDYFQKKVNALAKKYGAKNVLVAIDNDNTLLTSNVLLGGSAWFDWQEDLLFGKMKGAKGDQVAGSFDELLDAQGILFQWGTMRPTDPKVPNVLRQIQRAGHPTFVLTSRGHEYRYVTLRQFYNNSISFRQSAPAFKGKNPHLWKAYNKKTLAKQVGFTTQNGFTEKALKGLKLDRAARDVTYLEGVFFTAGQHKGVMLAIYLEKIGLKPKAIAFIDDKAKHCQRVSSALKHTGIDVEVFQYTKMDSKVAAARKETKKMAAQWKRLNDAINSGDQRINAIVKTVFGSSAVGE